MSRPAKRVVNPSNGAVIADNVRVANNFLTRFFGLMGKPGLPAGHGVWFDPCSSVHSFFMRFEFDAIFMAKDGTVLHLEERMKPWRVSKFVKGGKYVLELPGGVIAETGVKMGDVLELTT